MFVFFVGMGFFCFFVFLRLNYMIISQAAAVFYDAVALSVKDFPTTLNGQTAHTFLRHCGEILPLVCIS